MKNLFSCSRDIFSKKEAESWWTENGNRVRAIYNVPPFQHTVTNDRISSSEDEVQIHHALKILHNNQYLSFTRMAIHEDELFPEIFLDFFAKQIDGCFVCLDRPQEHQLMQLLPTAQGVHKSYPEEIQ